MEHVMDKLAQFVKNKIRLEDEILTKQIGSSEFINAYNEYKLLTMEQVKLSWAYIKKDYTSEEEACYYKMLDALYITTETFTWDITAERLAGLMQIDDGLKMYCKMQAGKREVFGAMLNYRALARTDLIEDAIKLL